MNNSITTEVIILYIFIIVIAVIAIAALVMLLKLKSKKKLGGANNENSSILKKREGQIEPLKSDEFKADINVVKVIESDSNFQLNPSEMVYPTISITNPSSESNFDVKSVYKCYSNEQYETVLPEIFYMAKPVENYFPVSAKSTSPADTVYRFKVGSNSNTATYEVHTLGAPLNEIIKRSETYLIAGCVEDNISNEQTKRITTLKDGTVKLENNKWIITNKALIRYE